MLHRQQKFRPARVNPSVIAEMRQHLRCFDRAGGLMNFKAAKSGHRLRVCPVGLRIVLHILLSPVRDEKPQPTAWAMDRHLCRESSPLRGDTLGGDVPPLQGSKCVELWPPPLTRRTTVCRPSGTSENLKLCWPERMIVALLRWTDSPALLTSKLPLSSPARLSRRARASGAASSCERPWPGTTHSRCMGKSG